VLLFKKLGPNVAREYDYCLKQAHQALIDKGEDSALWEIRQRVKHLESGVNRTFYAVKRTTPGPAEYRPLCEGRYMYDFKEAKIVWSDAWSPQEDDVMYCLEQTCQALLDEGLDPAEWVIMYRHRNIKDGPLTLRNFIARPKAEQRENKQWMAAERAIARVEDWRARRAEIEVEKAEIQSLEPFPRVRPDYEGLYPALEATRVKGIRERHLELRAKSQFLRDVHRRQEKERGVRIRALADFMPDPTYGWWCPVHHQVRSEITRGIHKKIAFCPVSGCFEHKKDQAPQDQAPQDQAPRGEVMKTESLSFTQMIDRHQRRRSVMPAVRGRNGGLVKTSQRPRCSECNHVAHDYLCRWCNCQAGPKLLPVLRCPHCPAFGTRSEYDMKVHLDREHPGFLDRYPILYVVIAIGGALVLNALLQVSGLADALGGLIPMGPHGGWSQ
jgi:hypothetical protein